MDADRWQRILRVLGSPADDETARVRLLREARNAAALNHPNICTVYEVGEATDRAFIAMEYVDGQSLSDRLSDDPPGFFRGTMEGGRTPALRLDAGAHLYERDRHPYM